MSILLRCPTKASVLTPLIHRLSHNILRACHAYKKEDLPTETKEWKFVLNPRYGHRLTEAQCSTSLFLG